MENSRVLNLAIEALEKQKMAVDAEITELRGQLMGKISGIAEKRLSSSRTILPIRKKKTDAERAAHSEAMRRHWQRKKAKAAKAIESRKPKSGPQTAAARKAVSERMKAYWAERRKSQASQNASAPKKSAPAKPKGRPRGTAK